MGRLILNRLGALVVVLFALTVAVFVIQAVLPADPVRASVGANATKEVVEAAREELGYNDPLVVQYAHFLGRLAQGDLGTSLRTRHPVTEDIAHFAPATIELTLSAALLAAVLGTVLGVWSALGGRGSGVARTVILAFASAPTFLVAIFMVLVFYRRLGWLPASGRVDRIPLDEGPTGLLTVDGLLHGNLDQLSSALRHLAIPSICLALGPAVAIGRVLRGSLLDVMGQDHVRTARAKGLRERAVIVRHGLRNALGPALSMAGLQVGLLLTGVVVIELVMAWPGLGLYTTQSIQNVDFPAVTGIVLVMGTAYVVVNTVVDVLQLLADPRVRATTTASA